MRHKSKRMYTAETVAQGVRTVSSLRDKALEFAPMSNQQPQVQTHDGYCVKCKGKKTFAIEDTKTMKNGALQHKGACPDCGTAVHAFAKGATDGG